MRSYQASSASDDTVRTGHPGPSRTNVTKNVRPVPIAEAFPQIRGSQMEHLFFSLPDHNETTCRTCRQGDVHPHPRAAAANNLRRTDPRDTDGGQAKMLDAAVVALSRAPRREDSDEDPLPPQAILARLLRELEDDFTHHKSCVSGTPMG